jgi:hypothetical protein
VSDNHDDELEIEALQRELDDAFQTTRPRTGFEDELWTRMQAQRPAPSRMRDALAGFFQGIREGPAVPAAALAAVLVVAIGVGIFAFSGFGRGSTATSSSAGGASQFDSGAAGRAASFGRLPTPVFNPATGGLAQPQPSSASPKDAGNSYSGPATLTWSGHLNLTISTAPVFRYFEPSANKADQFASGLGAALQARPAGLLGSYTASDYSLQVRGTVRSPAQSPTYFIVPDSTMPGVNAAGAGPADLASLFLAEHSLTPQWPSTMEVQTSGDQSRVRFVRQFDAPGYGPAPLVDSAGTHDGLEVDLNGNKVVRVAGLLPLSLDSAAYTIISADEAIRVAVTSSPQPAAGTGAPAVQLTQADLVYILAPAGDHSFYEPAFLFSGTFQLNGTTMTKQVLVPAVDPSQRT